MAIRLLERYAHIFFPLDTWIYVCRVKNPVVEATEDPGPEILHHILPSHITAGKPRFCDAGQAPK